MLGCQGLGLEKRRGGSGCVCGGGEGGRGGDECPHDFRDLWTARAPCRAGCPANAKEDALVPPPLFSTHTFSLSLSLISLSLSLISLSLSTHTHTLTQVPHLLLHFKPSHRCHNVVMT